MAECNDKKGIKISLIMELFLLFLPASLYKACKYHVVSWQGRAVRGLGAVAVAAGKHHGTQLKDVEQ